MRSWFAKQQREMLVLKGLLVAGAILGLVAALLYGDALAGIVSAGFAVVVFRLVRGDYDSRPASEDD